MPKISSFAVAAMILAVSASAPALAADPLREATEQAMPELLTLYRHFHAQPELSLNEVKTASKLAEEARAAGFTVTESVGGTGVVAVLTNGAGPVVLIRTDMDALPITERTGLPFASHARTTLDDGRETGVMHACGHDTHMASWIGTLRSLAQMKNKWRGTLVMAAQPAEERLVGASNMLADGLYTRFPKPDFALAFHNDNALAAGDIGITSGYALAGIDSVDIVVKGIGGHGGQPNTTKDPIVLAASIIKALQTLISRETDPRQPAVITVGSIKGGAKRNIVADEVVMQLSVRSFTPEVREQLLAGIERVVRGEAIAAGMPVGLMPVVTRTKESTPSTFNTPMLAARMKQLFSSRFGAERVPEWGPIMAGEDFGRFRLADPSIQSLIFSVGAVPRSVSLPGTSETHRTVGTLHSPFWTPDAATVIRTATEAMTAAALHLMKKAG